MNYSVNKSSSTNYEFLIKDHFQTNRAASGHSKSNLKIKFWYPNWWFLRSLICWIQSKSNKKIAWCVDQYLVENICILLTAIHKCAHTRKEKKK